MTTTLLDYLSNTYFVERRLMDSTAYQYTRSCRLLADHLGSDPPLKALDAIVLSEWTSRRESESAPRTARRNRADVLSVLNHAVAAGAMGPLRRVRRVRVPQVNPDAWSPGEVRSVIRGASASGRWCRWFRQAIRACWDTGLRRSDLFSVNTSRLDQLGQMVVTESKTGKVRLVRFSSHRSLPKGRPFACPFHTSALVYWWRKICRSADVGYGGFQKLRRSAATEIARTQGEEAAREFLGHSTLEMTRRHYIDATKIDKRAIAPGEL